MSDLFYRRNFHLSIQMVLLMLLLILLIYLFLMNFLSLTLSLDLGKLRIFSYFLLYEVSLLIYLPCIYIFRLKVLDEITIFQVVIHPLKLLFSRINYPKIKVFSYLELLNLLKYLIELKLYHLN